MIQKNYRAKQLLVRAYIQSRHYHYLSGQKHVLIKAMIWIMLMIVILAMIINLQKWTKRSFILTRTEWKTAFSSSIEKLKDEWREIFNNKLKNSGITCTLRFGNKHIKKGRRKESYSYFWFDTHCTNPDCSRSYRVILQDKVEVNTSPIFCVEVRGRLNHDRKVHTMARQLKGEECRRVGKQFFLSRETLLLQVTLVLRLASSFS